MGRKGVFVCAGLLALVLGVVAARPYYLHLLRTGRLTPIEIVEALRDPLPVRGWDAQGLYLGDGRSVALPGLRALPADSRALQECTRRGVEIDADGRVWGLVPIHHWCGNDPVRKHLARLDLAELLTYLQVGEPLTAPKNADQRVRVPGGQFSQHGWNVSEFYGYQTWQAGVSAGD